MLRNKVLLPEQACHRQNFSLSWLAENASSAERTQCPCSLCERGVSSCQGWRAVLCQHLPFGSALGTDINSSGIRQEHVSVTRHHGWSHTNKTGLTLMEHSLKPSYGSNTDWIPSLLGQWPEWRGWRRERFWCVKFTDYENAMGGEKGWLSITDSACIFFPSKNR